jgi:10-carbomethoxy-13-deoxycarminomycin esterase
MSIKLNTNPSFSQCQMSTDLQIAKVGNMDIWHETFGNKENPPLLLIMGSGAQGVLWPTEFCEKLASEGFYVIRYDQRDTGFSTCFNFKTDPYDLSDMAKDAIALLDFLKIPKAHLLGFSMGGPVAEYMAIHFRNRIDTISLMATSPDFFPTEGSLSDSTKEFHALRSKSSQIPINDEVQRLNQRVAMWGLQNGSKTPLDESWVRSVNQVFFSRMRNTECLGNHGQAMRRSEALIRAVPYQVQVPTLIFHGSEDPVFPPDHGKALAKAIPHSRYVPVDGMGHLLNPHFYPIVIEEIKKHAK